MLHLRNRIEHLLLRSWRLIMLHLRNRIKHLLLMKVAVGMPFLSSDVLPWSVLIFLFDMEQLQYHYLS
jgi:hypothetical protein